MKVLKKQDMYLAMHYGKYAYQHRLHLILVH